MSVITTDRRAVLDALATLIEYPREDWLARLAVAAERLSDALPCAAERLERAHAELRESTLGELEELYTRTFDLTPENTLDVGWHVHGETYGRGAFLVELRELEVAHGVDVGTELPDHLTTVLRLLARLEPEAAERLAPRLFTALAAVQRSLDVQQNPLRGVIAAVGMVLGAPENVPAPQPSEA